MGVAAKRFEHDFTENRIPEALKRYEDATHGATKNLTVEFDWKSFGEDTAAMDNVWTCWEQTLQGVEAVCSDDIGRAAIKKSLKKIRIVNSAKEIPAQVTFKGGILTMTMHFHGGTGSSPGWTEVQRVLEEGIE